MNAKASVALCAALFCGLCAWRATQPNDVDPATGERTVNVLRLMRSLNTDCMISEQQLEAAINSSLPCLKREMARINPVRLNNSLGHFDLMQECAKSNGRSQEAGQYPDSCMKYLPDISKGMDIEEIAKIFEKCLPGNVFTSVWKVSEMPSQGGDGNVKANTGDGADKHDVYDRNGAPLN